MANNNIFKEVAQKSDIVKVVSYFLGSDKVKRKGQVYYSICPFHNDHHPSMRIDPKRNAFKCFTCGEGGNSIDFAVKYQHLTPIEALKKVAEICSIPLELNSNFQGPVDTMKRDYPQELSALAEIERFYELTYRTTDGKAGQEYLKSRGISEDIRRHFHIGFAPSDPSLSIAALRNAKFSVSTLEKAGIIGDSFNLVDRFSNRLMFPISDSFGHVVGFSGRKVSEEQTGGKYINYPETPLFIKSKILYHFDQAKDTIYKDHFLYLVEGFMDVIAFVRAGINSVAGLMGTAFADEHLSELKRTKAQIRLALDFDEAGQEGQRSAMKKLLENGISFKVVRPSKKGKDADEILTKFGKDSLISIYSKLLDPVLFLLTRYLHGQKELTDITAVEAFLNECRPYYQSLTELEQSKDLDVIASITKLNREALLKTLNQKVVSSDSANKKDRSDNKYRYKKYRRDYQKEDKPYTDFSLSGKYANITNFSDFLNELDNLQVDGIPTDLIKNEANILFSILDNRDMYHAYKVSRVALLYQPFYVLSAYISEIYDSAPDVSGLEDADLDNILAKITSNQKRPVESDDSDDAFDLEDIEVPVEESKDLSAEEIALISRLVILKKQAKNQVVETKTIEKLLNIQKLYMSFVNFLNAAKDEGKLDDPETKRKIAEYKRDINICRMK